MELKQYQEKTLTVLDNFLSEAKIREVSEAFNKTIEKYPSQKNIPQYKSLTDLASVPIVCLQLPTGAGKTLLASHAIGLAAGTYLDTDTPFVLWLVPTEAIEKQTCDALKNPQHPYRQSLNKTFGIENVIVLDLSDINSLRATDAFDNVCIVVSTVQNFRIEKAKEDMRKKIYGHNENFESHFKNLTNNDPDLERDENGKVKFSFINMLHQIRPMVIVDEAHKMVSGLSKEVLKRINPSCIVEFTATPVDSNILFRVFPSALKAEEMVKLPFQLVEHKTWEDAVVSALCTHAKLEKFAKNDSSYIRPIILFQAQNKNLECTSEKLKDFLLTQENVTEENIAIATGKKFEIKNIDLSSESCKIKYIITVEALKEGWDCPFAYILCSTANIKSNITVEQLLGRVMRMPYAKKRQQEELNKAYAHVISSSFSEAAAEMYDYLVDMGFDGREAANNIVNDPKLLPENELHSENNGSKASETITLKVTTERAPDFSTLPQGEKEQICIIQNKDGSCEITITSMVSEEAEEAIVKATKKENQENVIKKIAFYRARTEKNLPPPVGRGKIFEVPALLHEMNGHLQPIGSDDFLQIADWSPLKYLAADELALTADEFAYNPKQHVFEFDLNGERITYKPVDTHVQLHLYDIPNNQDEFSLSRWLDKHCRENDISQPVMLEFCRKCIQALLKECDIATLWRGKQVLAGAIHQKITLLRDRAKKHGFQQMLFSENTNNNITVRSNGSFVFPSDSYAEGVKNYCGPYHFKKHYYLLPKDLKSSGEEFRCAQAIDACDLVKFWVRNIPRQYGSFSLPTSSDNFYPDFIAQLHDGRILVIEYKGLNLLDTDDTKEKINIGKLWEHKSNGKGIFMIVCEEKFDLTFENQIIKI